MPAASTVKRGTERQGAPMVVRVVAVQLGCLFFRHGILVYAYQSEGGFVAGL